MARRDVRAVQAIFKCKSWDGRWCNIYMVWKFLRYCALSLVSICGSSLQIWRHLM